MHFSMNLFGPQSLVMYIPATNVVKHETAVVRVYK